MAVVALEAGYIVPMPLLGPLKLIYAGTGTAISPSTVPSIWIFQVLPVGPPLGSIYSPSCFTDVENDVFEYDGTEVVFDNCLNAPISNASGGYSRFGFFEFALELREDFVGSF